MFTLCNRPSIAKVSPFLTASDHFIFNWKLLPLQANYYANKK